MHRNVNLILPEKQVLGRINQLFSLYYTLRISYNTHCIKNKVPNSSSIVACVFIATGMSLPSHCLGMLGGDRQTARWPHKPPFIF
jgi:hypothetical protein